MGLVIGMNSGSSFDGIDAVLVDLSLGADGHPNKPVYLHGISVDWPSDVRDLVLKAFQNQLSIFELTRLNYVVGAIYAQAATELMHVTGKSSEDIELIGVDGQTIYQEPPNRDEMQNLPKECSPVNKWMNGPYPVGLQIGESAVIAAHTNVTTVTHFRPADHALGGTGAPLMQYLDFVSFRDMAPVLTLNIGGIANCQVVHRDRGRMMAFDTGPGNVMLDFASLQLFGTPYDPDGRYAALGKPNTELLKRLLDHDFFRRKPPRSAWRLDFGEDFAARILRENHTLSREDMLATLCKFTAVSIAESIKSHVVGMEQYGVLIASGGGVRNKTLMRWIEQEIPSHIRLTVSDEYGIPAQFKEAMKFAALAFANEHHLANNIPACGGASNYTILGKTAKAPRHAIVNAES
ncbi:anhydro-N-acetylmuramic acid kinase [Alicyclobacillus cycloheptanicus]|uniref:Anhydro-N-acetylmuramic acid kinase n=1 Tax=Alicyclobacillus cycloheptanicus TaxID=1457 RepID=A0ABT9XHW1_9BACL|nr:anhydro-N-acetylmuramic acid kinase [Alicyclobacillus cycloheptanicus]MDQ0189896.1 anhydro-N-acetylmuramic acid kinase [Alicyclobacillus cycloheptanicus]WDM02200.1 anhydro-N-acetylmuramic acid kinase [Alicyclobacillus cycloheptanicus]